MRDLIKQLLEKHGASEYVDAFNRISSEIALDDDVSLASLYLTILEANALGIKPEFVSTRICKRSDGQRRVVLLLTRDALFDLMKRECKFFDLKTVSAVAYGVPYVLSKAICVTKDDAVYAYEATNFDVSKRTGKAPSVVPKEAIELHVMRKLYSKSGMATSTKMQKIRDSLREIAEKEFGSAISSQISPKEIKPTIAF